MKKHSNRFYQIGSIFVFVFTLVAVYLVLRIYFDQIIDTYGDSMQAMLYQYDDLSTDVVKDFLDTMYCDENIVLVLDKDTGDIVCQGDLVDGTWLSEITLPKNNHVYPKIHSWRFYGMKRIDYKDYSIVYAKEMTNYFWCSFAIFVFTLVGLTLISFFQKFLIQFTKHRFEHKNRQYITMLNQIETLDIENLKAKNEYEGEFYKSLLELQKTILSYRNKTDFYIHVVDSFENGILIFSQDMKVLFANQKALEYMLCGKTLFHYQTKLLNNQAFMKAVLNSLSNNVFDECDIRIGKNTIKCITKGISSDTNCCVVDMIDTTELSKSLDVNRTFFNNASHELKSPLTVIMGFQELLLYTNLSEEEKKEIIHKSISECNRMKNLVDEILLFAKKNNETRHFEECNIEEMLQNLVLSYNTMIKEKGITVVCDLIPNTYVVCHRPQLETILRNLLDNAIKYNVSNGTIFLSLQKVGDEVCFEIKDTGIGMSEQEMAHIYESFYRANRLNTSGSGLGLPLVKSLCDTYGFKIQVTSHLGEGTTIEINFK